MGAKRNRNRRHGIFCLEGDWEDDLRDPGTVEPVMRLLMESHRSHSPYIHRDVGTLSEFQFYLSKWTQKKYSPYPILYLGFHGEKGILNVGNKRNGGRDASLDDIAEWLGDKCHKKILFFASCSTMKVDGRRLQRFLRSTNALAVMGYTEDVDWIGAAAFETMILAELQDFSMTRTGLRAVYRRIHASLSRSNFYKKLGFKMVIRN